MAEILSRNRDLRFADTLHNLPEEGNGCERGIHEGGVVLSPVCDGSGRRSFSGAISQGILLGNSKLRFAETLHNLPEERNRWKSGIYECGMELSPMYWGIIWLRILFRNFKLRLAEPLQNLAEEGDGWKGRIHKGEVVLRLGLGGIPGWHSVYVDLGLGITGWHKSANSKLEIRKLKLRDRYSKTHNKKPRVITGLCLTALACRPAQANIHLARMFFDAIHHSLG